MKLGEDNPERSRGAMLLEVVIAMGALAVVIPLVFGALGEASKSCSASRAETASCWIVRACIDELAASRDGCPQWLPASTCGQAFPPDGEVWALAFSREGEALGRLPAARYHQGAREVAGKTVRFITALDAAPVPASPVMPALLVRVHISIQYPAICPENQRGKIDYYTYLP